MKRPGGQRSWITTEGFCYALNGLFALLSGTLSFQADLLSATVARSSGGPEFAHLKPLMHLKENWVADVVFGESFHLP
jgi:N-hydroxyarylamine O-acetyltransferase